MTTFKQAVSVISSMEEYRATKPQFVSFAVTAASLASSMLNAPGSHRRMVFITLRNMDRIPGFNSRIIIYDSRQALDFVGIVAEVSRLGAIPHQDGYWFFKLANHDTRTTVSSAVVRDWVHVLKDNPDTELVLPAEEELVEEE